MGVSHSMNHSQVEKVLCQFEATTEAIKGIEAKTIRLEEHFNASQRSRQNLMRHFEDATWVIDDMTIAMDDKTEDILDFFTNTLDTFACLMDSLEKTISGLGLADALPELQQELWPLMVPTVVLVLIVSVSNCLFGFYLAEDPDLAGSLTLEAILSPQTAQDMKDGTSVLRFFAIFHVVLIGIAFVYVFWEACRRAAVPWVRRVRRRRRLRRQMRLSLGAGEQDTQVDAAALSDEGSNEDLDRDAEFDQDRAASELLDSESESDAASADARVGHEGSTTSPNVELAKKHVMFRQTTDDPIDTEGPQPASSGIAGRRSRLIAQSGDSTSPPGGGDSTTSEANSSPLQQLTANSSPSQQLTDPSRQTSPADSNESHSRKERRNISKTSASSFKLSLTSPEQASSSEGRRGHASLQSSVSETSSPPTAASGFRAITPGGISSMLRNLQEVAKKEQEKHKAEMEQGGKRKGRLRVDAGSRHSSPSGSPPGSPRTPRPPRSARLTSS